MKKTKINIDLYTNEILIKILKKKSLRAHFISSYKNITHKKYRDFFIDYTCELLKNSTNSLEIDDMFFILTYCGIYDEKIIKDLLIFDTAKINYYAKLSILDFIIDNVKKINVDDFIIINNKFSKSRNYRIVKFQAYLNLCIYNPELFVDSVFLILKEEEGPTLFYRAIGTLNKKKFTTTFKVNMFNKITSIIKKKKFNQKVKLELLKIMDNLGNR